MKPYICAVCEERLDARDNPPTITSEGLVCEDCAADLHAEESPLDGEPAYWSPEVDR